MIVLALTAFLPCGVLCYDARTKTWWQIFDGAWLPPASSRDASLYLHRNTKTFWSCRLRTAGASQSPLPPTMRVESADIYVWDAVRSNIPNLSCFFSALGLKLCEICHIPEMRHYALLPALSGADLDAIATLLASHLPNGFIVVHSWGTLLHFHPQKGVASYLPSHLPQNLSGRGQPPVIFYAEDHRHFMPCCLATRCAVLRRLRTLEATHVSAQRCRFVSFPQPLLRQLLSTISGSMPRGRLFSEDAILAAFEKAEGIRFPIQEIQAIMPEVVQHCSLIADALSVPVSWPFLPPRLCSMQRKHSHCTPCLGR